ncbi:MAG: MFS transporter, partial [Solirubrobacteraceae bacterium]
MLDNTVVNVALPSMQRSLHLQVSELEWVVAGYALTFGAFMLTGGKLADLFGRRLMFVVGLLIFTGSSLACGLAGSATILIAARVVQGLGAALMNPSTLSIITVTFPPRQRGAAIGIWAGVSALALAIGPLVGGVITQHVNWNWIFFINIPIGVIGVTAAFAFIDESRDTSTEQRPDIGGLATSALGLFALTYALIEANNYGWGSTRILVAFAIAALALIAFILLELHQRLPMLDLSLFRVPTMSPSLLASMLQALANYAVLFLVIMYLQGPRGLTPIHASLLLVPGYVIGGLIGPYGGRLADRVAPALPATLGLGIQVIALLAYAQLSISTGLWLVVAASVVNGIGSGFFFPANNAAVMKAAPPRLFGISSGVLRTFSNVGMVFSFAMAILI